MGYGPARVAAQAEIGQFVEGLEDPGEQNIVTRDALVEGADIDVAVDVASNLRHQLLIGLVLQRLTRQQDHVVFDEVVAPGVGNEALAAHLQCRLQAPRSLPVHAELRAPRLGVVDGLDDASVVEHGRDDRPDARRPGSRGQMLFHGLHGWM